MFFHQILLRRRGQFGLIWMEAMNINPLRVTNRQALQVDVKQSCSRIAEYFNYPADGRESDTKRFSLYLSAHLMYGVVSIWRKQVIVLLSEAQEIKCRVWSDTNLLSNIDLRQPRHDQVNIADALPKVMEEDPFFGSLKRFNENWDIFIQDQICPDAPSPLSLSPFKRYDRESEADVEMEQEPGHPHTVPREEITLKELPFSTSPLLEVPIPGETDIPEVNGQGLDVVTDQAEEEPVELSLHDLYPNGLPQRLSPIRADLSPSRQEQTPDKAGTRKADGRPKGEKKRRKRDADDLNRTQPQETSPPKRPAREQDMVLEPAVEVTPPRRTRPRRRLLFLDEKKKLTDRDIKHNFTTPTTTCRHFELPRTSLKDTPSRLLKAPASKGILKNPVMRRMWERNCRSEETDSDWDFPVYNRDRRTLDRARAWGSIEEPQLREEEGVLSADDQPMEDIHPSTEQMVREAPSRETVRESSLSRSRTPQVSPLHGRLGQSPAEDRSSSLSRVGQADRSRSEGGRRGSSLEGSVVSEEEQPSVAPLGVLPEEVEMMPSPPAMPSLPEEEMSSPERKFKEQCEKEAEGKCITFRELCPPRVTSRRRAVKCFAALLERRVRERLFVRQLEDFGDIYISTDPRSLPEQASKAQDLRHLD